MSYFSLLFRTSEQEEKTKNRSDIKVCYHNRQQSPKSYQMVGNKLVLRENVENKLVKPIPCFYHDLNISKLEEYFYGESSQEGPRPALLLLAADEDTIQYRQSIFQDMEKPEIEGAMNEFISGIKLVKRLEAAAGNSDSLVVRGKYKVDTYCLLADMLKRQINIMQTTGVSSGIGSYARHLQGYHQTIGDERFMAARQIEKKVEKMGWCLKAGDDCLQFVKGAGANEEIHEPGFVKRLSSILSVETDTVLHSDLALSTGQLSLWLLEHVKRETPGAFTAITRFYQANPWPDTERLEKQIEEIIFYLHGLQMVRCWREKGFPVTFGEIGNSFSLENIAGFELANLTQLNQSAPLFQSPLLIQGIRLNNVCLNEGHKGICITGNNQGGKTTLLRSIGQIIYLTLMGLPAIGSRIQIPIISGLFTHFMIAENEQTADGKLVEELKHLKEIKRGAKEHACILLNEMFSSTTALDGLAMSQLFIRSCLSGRQMVFCVTHLSDLAGTLPELKGYCTGEEAYEIYPGIAENNKRAKLAAGKYQLLSEDIRRRINEQ